MSASATYPDSRQVKSRSGMWLGVSVVAGILCAVLAFTNTAAFWAGYLVGASFWLSVSTGCLAIALIHGVTGGRWGRAIGRPLHAGIRTLPYTIIAAWLMALGAAYVFPWASHPETMNPHQQVWLAPLAVIIRFAVICGIWLLYGFWLNARYRRDAADELSEVPQGRAAFGIILYFVGFSIVSIDFMMALSPAWASSMYPLIRILNCGVAALAVCAIAHCLRLVNPSREQSDRVQDIGNLLQAFNLLWTYLSFSQYILIWTGDISMEVEFYMERRTPFWMAGSIILFALHFVVPFLLMLSRNVKRGTKQLIRVASLLVVMCIIDLAWTLLPSIPVPTLPAVLSSLASVGAIGGIWVLLFQRAFASLPDMVMEDDEHAAAHHVIQPIPGDAE